MGSQAAITIGYITTEAVILILNGLLWPKIRDYLVHVKFERKNENQPEPWENWNTEVFLSTDQEVDTSSTF